MATDPTLITSDAAHAMVSYERVLATVWRGAMTPAAVRATITPTSNAARQFPGEVVVALVVEPDSPVPGDDVRSVYTELIRTNLPLRCTVLVAEGSSFRGAVVRSIVTSILLVVRPATPMKVTSTVPEGAKWASAQGAPRSGGAALERDIVRAVEAARARIGGR